MIELCEHVWDEQLERGDDMIVENPPTSELWLHPRLVRMKSRGYIAIAEMCAGGEDGMRGVGGGPLDKKMQFLCS